MSETLPPSPELANIPEPILESGRPPLKLDLGAGQNPQPGFEGVDIFPGSKHVVNLLRYPWPWADGSVDELYSSHFFEHIPDIMVDRRTGAMVDPTDINEHTVDALFRVYEECWRVLKMGGKLTVIVPAARHHRGFQDPTHRRFFVLESFFYAAEPWRKAAGIDHYNARLNFEPHVDWSTDDAFNLYSAERKEYLIKHATNVIYDYRAIMTKMPLLDTPSK